MFIKPRPSPLTLCVRELIRQPTRLLHKNTAGNVPELLHPGLLSSWPYLKLMAVHEERERERSDESQNDSCRELSRVLRNKKHCNALKNMGKREISTVRAGSYRPDSVGVGWWKVVNRPPLFLMCPKSFVSSKNRCVLIVNSLFFYFWFLQMFFVHLFEFSCKIDVN